MKFLLTLPYEANSLLLEKIFVFLTPKEICQSVSLVCTQFAAASTSSCLWKHLYYRHYPEDPIPRNNEDPYRLLFFTRKNEDGKRRYENMPLYVQQMFLDMHSALHISGRSGEKYGSSASTPSQGTPCVSHGNLQQIHQLRNIDRGMESFFWRETYSDYPRLRTHKKQLQDFGDTERPLKGRKLMTKPVEHKKELELPAESLRSSYGPLNEALPTEITSPDKADSSKEIRLKFCYDNGVETHKEELTNEMSNVSSCLSLQEYSANHVLKESATTENIQDITVDMLENAALIANSFEANTCLFSTIGTEPNGSNWQLQSDYSHKFLSQADDSSAGTYCDTTYMNVSSNYRRLHTSYTEESVSGCSLSPGVILTAHRSTSSPSIVTSPPGPDPNSLSPQKLDQVFFPSESQPQVTAGLPSPFKVTEIFHGMMGSYPNSAQEIGMHASGDAEIPRNLNLISASVSPVNLGGQALSINHGGKNFETGSISKFSLEGTQYEDRWNITTPLRFENQSAFQLKHKPLLPFTPNKVSSTRFSSRKDQTASTSQHTRERALSPAVEKALMEWMLKYERIVDFRIAEKSTNSSSQSHAKAPCKMPLYAQRLSTSCLLKTEAACSSKDTMCHGGIDQFDVINNSISPGADAVRQENLYFLREHDRCMRSFSEFVENQPAITKVHMCTSKTCLFDVFPHLDLYICRATGAFHVCDRFCDRATKSDQDVGFSVCPVSGRMFENLFCFKNDEEAASIPCWGVEDDDEEVKWGQWWTLGYEASARDSKGCRIKKRQVY